MMEYEQEMAQEEQGQQEQLAAIQIAQMQQQARQDQSSMPVSKDRDFMQWLFNLKEYSLAPLRYNLEGKTEISPNNWDYMEGQTPNPIMNYKGITWACSVVSDYLSPEYIISNYDEEAMNWVMRGVAKTVWNSLTKQYEEFALKKINIPKVAWAIIHKVHAILLGARGNGYREFFMSTHHIDEVKTTHNTQQSKEGMLGGLFKKKPHMSGVGTY